MTVRSAIALTALVATGVAREGSGRAQEPDTDAIAHACDRGNARSCVQLGILYSNGDGVPRDERKAVTLYQKACDHGSAAACSNLGSFYAVGRAVPKDGVKAATLFLKACNQGETAGCYGLGFAYEWGLGLPRDPMKAVALYRRACKGGDDAGCSKTAPAQPALWPPVTAAVQTSATPSDDTLQTATLAVMPGSEAADTTAITRRCDGGKVLSCLELGILYSNGHGVSKNEGKAATLFLQACQGGSPLGCDLLGFAYESGLGVAKDEVKAATFYQRGCEGGDATGCSKANNRRSAR